MKIMLSAAVVSLLICIFCWLVRDVSIGLFGAGFNTAVIFSLILNGANNDFNWD